MPDGFLILDKPVGPSSAQQLNRVKRLLPRGTKIGHAGTLDPLASGVLVALIGKGTKRSDQVMGSPKQYEATIRLGATSETDDAEGPITSREVDRLPDETTVLAALNRFVGFIEQLPPNYSALKLGGRRACDRVRDGETVVLKPRTIRIDRIQLLNYAWPDLTIRMDCGKGTYVRSLARDVGAALGVGGYLWALRRTRVGLFTIELSVPPERLVVEGIDPHLLPLEFLDDSPASSPSTSR